MAENHINQNDEMYEVLNTFPFLSQFFEKLQIPHYNIPEEITVKQFLLAQQFSEEETHQIIKRINREISFFLKHVETPINNT